MKKKVRLTVLMLAGVLAYFASEKPTSAGPWCNEWCDLYDGQYCCINPDCSMTCW